MSDNSTKSVQASRDWDRHEVRSRESWMDLARGVCVILVVLHHVIRQMVANSSDAWPLAGEWWGFIDQVLTPIRIPLFFFVSGMLASTNIRKTLFASRRKFVVPIYLYLVWSVLLSLREFLPGSRAVGGSPRVTSILVEIIMACSGYWYLFALPLYFVFGNLMVRLHTPRILVLAPLAVLSIFRAPLTEFFAGESMQYTDSPSLLGSVLANVVFFMFGVYGRDLLARIVRPQRSVLSAVILGLFYCALLYFYSVFDSGVIFLAASCVGVLLGVWVSAIGVKSRLLERAGFAVGSRTLPIYVLQFFFISLLSLLWGRVGSAVRSILWVGWIYPAVATLAIVCTSLVIYVTLNKTYFRMLFRPPLRWVVST